MASRARTALGMESVTVIADRGYYSSPEIRHCHEARIATIIPKPVISNATAAGRFSRDDSIYDRFRDEYRCAAGDRLIYRYTSDEKGQLHHRYWSSNCKACAFKSQSTPSEQRRLTRWEHEDVLEQTQARLDRYPEAMRIRRSTVEHPFGTLKQWMGATHFLTKTLKRVGTEMSLLVLAYNIKRVLRIMTMKSLMQAMGA